VRKTSAKWIRRLSAPSLRKGYVERQYIAEALKRNKGNISRTARNLEMTRRGLQLKIARLSVINE
jgi:DNA-binding NtrC family response regulator